MGLISIPDYVGQIGTANPLRLSQEQVREQIAALADELKEVETQIAALYSLVRGLSVLYGPDIVPVKLLEAFRPEPRTNKRGLTTNCLWVLQHAVRPYAVSEICRQINEVNPELLLLHRKPMASVMSVLRSLERQHQVVRGREQGRSVWHCADWTTARQQLDPARAPECFQ